MNEIEQKKKWGWKNWLLGIFIIVFVITPILISLFYNPLKADVPQTVCTIKCGFAYRINHLDGGNLIISGYKDYPRTEQDKESYLINKINLNEEEINSLEKITIGYGVDNEKVLGKLNGNRCIYMGFKREKVGFNLEKEGSEELVKCE